MINDNEFGAKYLEFLNSLEPEEKERYLASIGRTPHAQKRYVVKNNVSIWQRIVKYWRG